MNNYYVIGVIAISYHGFGVLSNIVSKMDVVDYVTIGDIYTALHMPWLHENVMSSFEKK